MRSPVSHAGSVRPPLGPGLVITPVSWQLQSLVECEGPIVNIDIKEVYISHVLEGIVPASNNNDKEPPLENHGGCAGVTAGLAQFQAELHPGRGGGCQVNILNVVKKSLVIVVTWII